MLLIILNQLEPDLNYGHDADDLDNHNDDNDFSVAMSNLRFLNQQRHLTGTLMICKVVEVIFRV